MKKTLLTLLLAFGTLFGAFAQLTFEYDTTRNSGTAMASTNDFAVYNDITNVGYDNDTFKWLRTRVLAPSGWTSAVCDVFLCHDTAVDSAVFLLKKGKTGQFSFHFYSNNGVGGHAEMDVCIYNVSDPSNCKKMTAIYDAWTTSEKEVDPLKVRIFPNPVKSTLNIELPSTASSGIKMNILNVLGQNVKTFTYTGNKGYDVASLDKGVYFLKFEVDGKSFVKKFQVAE